MLRHPAVLQLMSLSRWLSWGLRAQTRCTNSHHNRSMGYRWCLISLGLLLIPGIGLLWNYGRVDLALKVDDCNALAAAAEKAQAMLQKIKQMSERSDELTGEQAKDMLRRMNQVSQHGLERAADSNSIEEDRQKLAEAKERLGALQGASDFLKTQIHNYDAKLEAANAEVTAAQNRIEEHKLLDARLKGAEARLREHQKQLEQKAEAREEAPTAGTPAPTLAACQDRRTTGVKWKNGSPATCAQLSRYCTHRQYGSKIRSVCPRTCNVCKAQASLRATAQSPRVPPASPASLVVPAASPVNSKIHVCYTPEDTESQLSYMMRSMNSIWMSAEESTRKRLVFHIFGNELNLFSNLLSSLKWRDMSPLQIKVYRGATNIVPQKRRVYSNLKKLAKEEVYVRFFIPDLLDWDVEKYLYLDTDTIVVSDLALAYDVALHSKQFTLAAGVQNTDGCTMDKMFRLEDERIQHLGILPWDVCLSGGAFIVDRWRWTRENRTQRWQHWVEENYKQQLYYLGCMPPQMLDFHGQWEQLPDNLIRDWKKHSCCPPEVDEPLLLESVIIHPMKQLTHPGSFRHLLEVDGKVAGYQGT